jgi:hypothetical protein
MRQHILLQKLNQEGKSYEIEFWKRFYLFFHMSSLVFDALIMEKGLVGLEEYDRLLEIAKELFYEAGDEMRIFDLFQILVVSFAQLVERFVLLIDRDALSKDAFFVEALWFGPEVVNEQLNNDWDADVPDLIILKLIDLLRDQSRNRIFKLFLVSSLLFRHVLALQIDTIAHQRWPSFQQLWEFLTNLLRDESHEILN